MSTIRNVGTPNATETHVASVVVCPVFFFAVFPVLALAISPCLDDESEHLPLPRSNHLLVFKNIEVHVPAQHNIDGVTA